MPIEQNVHQNPARHSRPHDPPEAMPEKIRSSPAEINAQHQLELKSETPLQ
jgi:hypothetical protein